MKKYTGKKSNRQMMCADQKVAGCLLLFSSSFFFLLNSNNENIFDKIFLKAILKIYFKKFIILEKKKIFVFVSVKKKEILNKKKKAHVAISNNFELIAKGTCSYFCFLDNFSKNRSIMHGFFVG